MQIHYIRRKWLKHHYTKFNKKDDAFLIKKRLIVSPKVYPITLKQTRGKNKRIINNTVRYGRM